jgi:hypothetical protein
MGFFDTLFGGGAEKEAAEKNRALYSDYLSKGTGYLDSGLSASKGYLDSAYGSLAGLASKYGAGSQLYLDALGVNGTDAAKAAQSSFTNNPGNNAAITAGLDAINRRRAAGGMLNSGNADLDALTFGQNLQNQQYNGWLDRLGGLISPEMQATQGGAAVQGSLSDLYQNDAANRIGLVGNYTSGTAGANNYEAAGKAAGAKNLLGAGLSLASLAAGGFGGGGLGSALKAGSGSFTGTDLALNNRLFPGYGTG